LLLLLTAISFLRSLLPRLAATLGARTLLGLVAVTVLGTLLLLLAAITTIGGPLAFIGIAIAILGTLTLVGVPVAILGARPFVGVPITILGPITILSGDCVRRPQSGPAAARAARRIVAQAALLARASSRGADTFRSGLISVRVSRTVACARKP
jgi:hypothetical protein